MAQDPSALRGQVAKIFSDKLEWDVPSMETDLVEAGMLDSVNFLQLLLHLEEDFGLTISLDDIEIDNFRSIARISEFLLNHHHAVKHP